MYFDKAILLHIAICGWIFFLSKSPAEAQVAPASGSQSIWWVGIVSALIGTVGALLTPVVKDLIIQRSNDRTTKFNTQREIFRNYAAPLVGSCEKLLWRFKEIFIEKRHHFLKSATLPLVYNEYKRNSTLYRIACLLGWIRAINLELNALPRGAYGFLTPVSKAIGEIQSALADGPHVEVHRLERMCTIWQLNLAGIDEERKKSLATKFEVNLYDVGGDDLRHDSMHLKNMTAEKKFKICKSLSDFLCDELHRTRIADNVIHEYLNSAISGLSYREALIYRDWQDAIGESMLEPDLDSVRRFKLIGYEKFEDVLEGTSLWMEVFRDSIIDIDFDAIDPSDFRAKQLRDLASAVAKVVLSFSETEEGDLVDSPIRAVAAELAQQTV